MKKIFALILSVIMVVSLVACGNTKPTAETVSATLDGVEITAAEIVDNVPMLKGSDFGIDKDLVTFEEVKAAGYEVVYNDDKIVITKIQDIGEGEKDDAIIETPEDSTDTVTPGTESTTPDESQNGDETTETGKPDGKEETTTPSKPEETAKPEETQKPTETQKPEQKPEEPKPTEPVKPENTQKPEDNKSDDFENTQGEGKLDQSEAGVFYPHSSASAPVYNGSADYNSVVNKLNGYVFDVYGYRFFRNGLAQNDNQTMGTAKIVQNSDGKFGIAIIGWRHSYDSSATVNCQLNAVLEAFYYFTGSKDVAYRLWSVVDSIGINGASNTSGATYGFTESSINSTSAKLTYGSYEIVLDWSTGENTFWFN